VPVRGRGFRRSPPDSRDWGLHRLGVVRADTLPDVISFEPLIDRIYDQGPTQSCTGWATARAWHLRAQIQGDKSARHPSALALYALARCAEVALPDATLTDEGTYPRLVLQAADALGVCPLETWSDLARVNDRPDWESLREGIDRRRVRYARINGAHDVRVALAAGHPVTIGIDVDAAFEEWTGGVWPGPTGPVLGGHDVCAVAYDSRGIRIINSWSEAWSDNGLAWLSDGAVDRSECWAVDVVTP
jgi:hypothetical protein